MQRQAPSFSHIISRIQCHKHNQPIVLVCIQKQCPSPTRTFCFECNDESQLVKNTHTLISIKKFDSIYSQYNQALKLQFKPNIKQKIINIKEKIQAKFNQIQNLISVENQEIFIQGEQEQIIKGKLNNLLKNQAWSQIFDMKNSQLRSEDIYKKLKQRNSSKAEKDLECLEKLQKTVLFQLQKTLIDLRSENKPKQLYLFSNERKNQNLKLSSDRRAVSNTSEYGHYFSLLQKDFDIHTTSFQFNIGKIDPQVSYWFGFTFPSLSENKKWANIYDQKLGGFFIVIFQNGNKINFWNHQKQGVSNSQQLKAQVISSFQSIELSINFQLKQLYFNAIVQGKKIPIKDVKPIKWYGKIYPSVGLYGKNGMITIQ